MPITITNEAYQNALNINLPGVFFTPLFQAAALGQLERKADADAALAALLQLRPDFPARASELIGRLIKADGQVEHIIKGLQKAGLHLERQDGRGEGHSVQQSSSCSLKKRAGRRERPNSVNTYN